MLLKYRYLLIFLVVILSAILSSLPNFHPEHYLGTGYHWWMDMMIHEGYYFLVSVLLYSFYKKEKRREYLFITILLFSYILELAQKEVPGRSFSGLDFLSNTIGVGWHGVFVYCMGTIEAQGHREAQRIFCREGVKAQKEREVSWESGVWSPESREGNHRGRGTGDTRRNFVEKE